MRRAKIAAEIYFFQSLRKFYQTKLEKKRKKECVCSLFMCAKTYPSPPKKLPPSTVLLPFHPPHAHGRCSVGVRQPNKKKFGLRLVVGVESQLFGVAEGPLFPLEFCFSTGKQQKSLLAKRTFSGDQNAKFFIRAKTRKAAKKSKKSRTKKCLAKDAEENIF